ncbi:hypothetical protein WISP_31527 [Willisornis vidua]|uniref:Reverse transcriptase domain-containing protein n=1 Tax=Willisornis vidua TaxID=1566151 RepID=A0ABQ9DQV7_9PASS|nr:hypothetical protein WISP_31527 [Willisornis vidua]
MLQLGKIWRSTEVVEDWRKANVIPAFKKDNLGNYRQVSLTSVLGKMVDQIVLETLSKYMKDKKVTGSSHNGFMKEKAYFTSPKVFYVSHNLLIDKLLNKFADDTKLGGVADTPEDCVAIHKHVTRLEKRADRKLLKFGEGKMPSFACELVAPLAPVYAGANRVESCFAEKDLKFLVDKLNMKQQCVLMAEKSQQLPGVQRKVTLPFCAVLMKVWCCDRFPGEPLPNHPRDEELVPPIHPKPPVAQPHATLLSPVTAHEREELLILPNIVPFTIARF